MTTRTIALMGLMGVGKTSVGRVLARMLRRPFVDTDVLVEQDAGCSIAELVEREGEERFRAFERAAVARVAALNGQVVALGGGAPLRPRNQEVLQAGCELVLLEAPVSLLAARIGTGAERRARPLLGGAESDVEVAARLTRLLAEREQAYADVASWRVDSGHRPPRAVAAEIATWARAKGFAPAIGP